MIETEEGLLITPYAPEPEAVAMMVALSTGEASEEEFAARVRQHLR